MSLQTKNSPPSCPKTREEELSLINDFLNDPSGAKPNDVYIDITTLARAFGKHAGHFLAQRMTKEFINALVEDESIDRSDLVRKGGDRGAVNLADIRVAVECARWACVRFRVWYNRTLLRSAGTDVPTCAEMLGFLYEEVRRNARAAARRLELFHRQFDPERLPGMARHRRVRAIDHEMPSALGGAL